MTIKTVYGVDFSGAKLAGLNIWVAAVDTAMKRLVALDRLSDLTGSAERAPALKHLVELIGESEAAVWGIDFPFALPIEVAGAGVDFNEQLAAVAAHDGDAFTFGRACVERALRVGDKMHLRRTTDVETRTPFDCYHYRIICQTFHGMRDVLLPLRSVEATRIAPFDHITCGSGKRASKNASHDAVRRVVVEACPGSTLKRWGVPHNNYKQPAGGPLEPKRLRNRRLILDRLRQTIDMDAGFVRKMQRNPGGDALDAAIAAAGVWEAWDRVSFDEIAAHPRYSIEGMIFA